MGCVLKPLKEVKRERRYNPSNERPEEEPE
jgi:hypothetical protein